MCAVELQLTQLGLYNSINSDQGHITRFLCEVSCPNFAYFDFVRYDFSHLYCDVMEAIACAPLSHYGFKVPFQAHQQY